jgi:hypothetical protein
MAPHTDPRRLPGNRRSDRQGHSRRNHRVDRSLRCYADEWWGLPCICDDLVPDLTT